jgi:hypothetical protein
MKTATTSPKPPKPDAKLTAKLKAAEERNNKLTKTQRVRLAELLTVLESDGFNQFYTKDPGEFSDYICGDLTDSLAPSVKKGESPHEAAQEIMIDRLASLFKRLL